MASAQTAPAGSTSDQSNQSTSATGSSSGQTGAAAGANAGSAAADQSAAGNAADQSAAGTSNAQGNKLPQTGSELPLLALLGVGSLSAGVWKAYYKK
jgi:LPXTG-motif cell wall-anchored protein